MKLKVDIFLCATASFIKCAQNAVSVSYNALSLPSSKSSNCFGNKLVSYTQTVTVTSVSVTLVLMLLLLVYCYQNVVLLNLNLKMIQLLQFDETKVFW